MKSLAATGAILLALTYSSALAEIALSTSKDGIVVTIPSSGKYTLQAPRLTKEKNDYQGEKPAIENSGDKVVCTYASGAKVELAITNDKQSVTITYGDAAERGVALRFVTLLPIALATGGQFAIGDASLEAFPTELASGTIGQGDTTNTTILDSTGKGYTIQTVPGWHQITDNRAFNWPVFAHAYNYSFATFPGRKSFEISFKEPSASAQPSSDTTAATPTKFSIDRFGQIASKAYPEKVTAEADLKADIKSESIWSKNLPSSPPLDIYGGLADSGAAYNLKKTGFFHVEKIGDRQVLVSPEGNLFFQLGINTLNNIDDFTLVAGRKEMFELVPPAEGAFATAYRADRPGAFSFYVANAIRKFQTPYDKDQFAARSIERLRRWGFNSAGAWANVTESFKKLNFPYCPMLPLTFNTKLKKIHGAEGVFDPFEADFETLVDAAFAKDLGPRSSDPLVIGYYIGNEALFQNTPRAVAEAKSKLAAKRELIALLQRKYSTIENFNAAWKPAAPPADFAAAAELPLFVTTQAASRDMAEFMEHFYETYFGTIHRMFKRYDHNHLLIGGRFQPGTASDETLVRIAGKYNDVISVNYYTYRIDSSFLDKIHRWSGGRPLLLSEWFFSTTDQGLQPGSKEVENQENRGKAYRNYVEQAASLPYVVGQQWFSYMDQSATGRWFQGFQGEGNNNGLINVVDRPYRPFIEQAAKTNAQIYDIVLGKSPAFVYDDPRFTGSKLATSRKTIAVPKSLPAMKIDGAFDNLPGRPPEVLSDENLVAGKPDGKSGATFHVLYDEENLYVLADVKDATPRKNNNTGGKVWSGDGIELFIGPGKLDAGGALQFDDRQILIGAGANPVAYSVQSGKVLDQCKVVIVEDVNQSGYVVEAAIPWKTLGIEPKPGTVFLFDLAVDFSDDGSLRNRQHVWSGSDRNSSERGSWGTATLL